MFKALLTYAALAVLSTTTTTTTALAVMVEPVTAVQFAVNLFSPTLAVPAKVLTAGKPPLEILRFAGSSVPAATISLFKDKIAFLTVIERVFNADKALSWSENRATNFETSPKPLRVVCWPCVLGLLGIA